jgi:8-oxo-dGTP pyrophosphatase MutT (NUDIX family)
LIASTAVEIVAVFDTAGDGLAEKSRELTLGLLADTPAPFSRDQYAPGHITCTALVFHPRGKSILVMHHHRLKRWLLPGGHVEPDDPGLADAAAREACEETAVELDSRRRPFLAGMDVHGIPARKAEPFHLHHDLIWCFRAASEEIAATDEAPEVRWAIPEEWNVLGVAPSIQNSVWRAKEHR